MSSNTNQKEKKEKQDVWVEVEPIEFNDQCQTMFITSLDLAETFNAFFRSCLEDYEGCFLLPSTNGDLQYNDTRVELNLYLTKKNNGTSADGKIVSLVDIAREVDGNATMSQRIKTLNNRASQKLYSMTEDSTKFFESLSYQGKWDERLKFEQVDPANRNIVVVKIAGIDPVKIIRKIYGTKIDGETFEYRLSCSHMVGPNNYMLKIDRLNAKNMEALAKKVGFVQPNANSILMVR